VAIRHFTTAILRQSGINTSLGQNWVKRFLQRQNARIKIKKSRNVPIARITAMSTSRIAPWFDQLTNVIHQYNLTSSRIYNMDETGFQEGESSIKKVVGSRAIKGAQFGCSTNTAWISIIECICANGTRLHPTIIFKGDRPQSN